MLGLFTVKLYILIIVVNVDNTNIIRLAYIKLISLGPTIFGVRLAAPPCWNLNLARTIQNCTNFEKIDT